MHVERVEIAKLIADPSNARKHPERNLATIVGSLHRFGQVKPIVIDKTNVVRAGNGTLEAARSLGWTHLDCVRTQLDGSDATAYAIADNRTSELAEWDGDVLVALLESLAGVYGIITGEDGDSRFWLEIDDDVQIRIARVAISGKASLDGDDAVANADESVSANADDDD